MIYFPCSERLKVTCLVKNWAIIHFLEWENLFKLFHYCFLRTEWTISTFETCILDVKSTGIYHVAITRMRLLLKFLFYFSFFTFCLFSWGWSKQKTHFSLKWLFHKGNIIHTSWKNVIVQRPLGHSPIDVTIVMSWTLQRCGVLWLLFLAPMRSKW